MPSGNRALIEGRLRMSNDIEFTGERFLPEISGQIAFEHLHRYYFAKNLIGGRRVLDVACGEGYGSWILSKSALDVVGVDIAPEAITHAREKYVGPNIKFVESSAAKLPFDDSAFDAVVSFETIEHHDLHREMLSEIKRVLKQDGLLIISSPNKQYYSIEPGYKNPFHVKELYREEFVGLIKSYFASALLLSQRVVHGSLLVMEDEDIRGDFDSMTLSDKGFGSTRGLFKPLYDLLVATNGALPEIHSSMFEAEVHGLEPARFYGIHLPDRVAKADAAILELQQRVKERGLSEDEERELFRSLFGRIDVFQAEGKALAGGLANDLAHRNAQIEGLDEKIESLDAKIEGLCQAIGDLRAGQDQKDAYLETYRQKLEAADQALAVIRGSWSWRLTSPLRYLKSILSSASHHK